MLRRRSDTAAPGRTWPHHLKSRLLFPLGAAGGCARAMAFVAHLKQRFRAFRIQPARTGREHHVDRRSSGVFVSRSGYFL